MKSFFGLLVLASLAPGLPAQIPEFKRVLSTPTLGRTEISPDGNRVAYTVSTPDWKADVYRSQIWVCDLATRDQIQITHGTGVMGFAWAPDSHRIAFTANRDGSAQIYLIDVNGGEAAKVTDVKEGIEDFEWCPDGRRLAYRTSPPDADRTRRKDTLGDFTVVESDENRSRVGVVPVPLDRLPEEPAEGKLLANGQAFTVEGITWSPDGSRLLLMTQAGSGLRHILDRTLFVLGVAADQVWKVAGPGAFEGAVWSPDGNSIAYTAEPNLAEAFYANPAVSVVSASGLNPQTIPCKFDEEVGLQKWTSKGILFSATLRTSDKLFRLDPANGAAAELTPKDERSRGGWSFTKDGSTCAYRLGSESHWPRVSVASVDSFADREIRPSWGLGSSAAPPTRTTVRWKSKDGAEIEGVLIKPVPFDPAKKYPLLVEIHGGPTGTSEPVDGRPYAYPLEEWVKRGAVVLQPNYRGSAGYGAAFRALNVRNLGVGDAWDVLSGVDYLVKQGFVDESRMGCMGWSEGGYISAFITTTSDRFKAISVGAGISDWATYYYLTDITDFTRQYLKANPWTDPDIYRKTSPITYVKNAKTPTLIQQGSNDPRVPVPNGYELFRALRDLNVPSKFILYTGFGHGVTKPKEQLALLQHNWEWFGHYLWGDPLPSGG